MENKQLKKGGKVCGQSVEIITDKEGNEKATIKAGALEITQEQYTSGNNEVLVDLHLKSTRATTFIDMLLDINNREKLPHFIFQNNKDYEQIQTGIIETLNVLSKLYIDTMNYLHEKEDIKK